MKKSVWLFSVALSLLLFVAGIACRKSSDTSATGTDPVTLLDSTDTEPGMEPARTTFATSCPFAPNYGDSIIYDKWKGPFTDYKIKPAPTSLQGTYVAVPQGLVINATTGEINITKSEKGVRFMVGFVKKGTTDTCYTKLIIGGVTYIDKIYVMENNDTLAVPFYNANPVAPAVCDNSDDNDYPGNGHGGNNKCEFDDDGDQDGLGLGDEPPLLNTLNNLLIRVRTVSGVINLKKSLLDGAFGLLPLNGTKINATLYYRLNDATGKKLQKIPVQFIYYNKVSDIPTPIKTQVVSNQQNFNEYKVVSYKPRPPMIILTRYSN